MDYFFAQVEELDQPSLKDKPFAVGGSNSREPYEILNDVESALGNHSRVLLRPSGTEPVLRVMVEADDEKLAKKHAEYLVEKVKSKI